MHTEGKLVYQENSDAYTNIIRDSKGQFIVSTPQGICKIHEANARRLVACWNACEGISTDSLEKALALSSQPMHEAACYRKFIESENEELAKERNELLEKVRSLEQEKES